MQQAGASSKRNKIILITGIIGVLILAGIFAAMTSKALSVRAATSSVFNKYVLDNGIGHAEESDDASGFQGDFCVLHLNKPIPADQLESQTLDLLFHYHDLDGGDILSIQYDVPGTGKKVIEADAKYDAPTKTVHMTLNGNGTRQVITKTVDWSDGKDAS